MGFRRSPSLITWMNAGASGPPRLYSRSACAWKTDEPEMMAVLISVSTRMIAEESSSPAQHGAAAGRQSAMVACGEGLPFAWRWR